MSKAFLNMPVTVIWQKPPSPPNGENEAPIQARKKFAQPAYDTFNWNHFELPIKITISFKIVYLIVTLFISGA